MSLACGSATSFARPSCVGVEVERCISFHSPAGSGVYDLYARADAVGTVFHRAVDEDRQLLLGAERDQLAGLLEDGDLVAVARARRRSRARARAHSRAFGVSGSGDLRVHRVQLVEHHRGDRAGRPRGAARRSSSSIFARLIAARLARILRPASMLWASGSESSHAFACFGRISRSFGGAARSRARRGRAAWARGALLVFLCLQDHRGGNAFENQPLIRPLSACLPLALLASAAFGAGAFDVTDTAGASATGSPTTRAAGWW